MTVVLDMTKVVVAVIIIIVVVVVVLKKILKNDNLIQAFIFFRANTIDQQ